jgi:membrane protein DedA with SNARE-associated domain
MEQFIASYGYWAILLGTFLEGETILILAGVAAHRGYLSLAPVILAAFAGSLFGDQLYFFLGRYHGEALIQRRPHWRVKMDTANRLIDRFQVPLILGFRFLYGLRTVLPFALGASSVGAAQFLALNAIGAFVWAAVVGGGGYLFGNLLETLIGDMKRLEDALFVGIAVVGAGVWAVHFMRRRRRGHSQRS